MAPSHGPPARVLSPLFFPAKSLLLPKPRGNKEHPKTTWFSFLSSKTAWSSLYSPRQSCIILSLLPQNLVVLLLLQNCVVLLSLWLPFLGFKSQHLPSSAAPFPTPPTISYTCQHSLFFQLYWVAIVSLGRCGPMAWSQSSPSSPAGPVTRGSYFPVPSWVEFGPIPLAQACGGEDILHTFF